MPTHPSEFARWRRVVDALTAEAARMPGDTERAMKLVEIGELYRAQISDVVGAGRFYRRAVEVAPTQARPVLERLRDLAMSAAARGLADEAASVRGELTTAYALVGRWHETVDILRERAAATEDVDARAGFALEAAWIAADALDDMALARSVLPLAEECAEAGAAVELIRAIEQAITGDQSGSGNGSGSYDGIDAIDERLARHHAVTGRPGEAAELLVRAALRQPVETRRAEFYFEAAILAADWAERPSFALRCFARSLRLDPARAGDIRRRIAPLRQRLEQARAVDEDAEWPILFDELVRGLGAALDHSPSPTEDRLGTLVPTPIEHALDAMYRQVVGDQPPPEATTAAAPDGSEPEPTEGEAFEIGDDDVLMSTDLSMDLSGDEIPDGVGLGEGVARDDLLVLPFERQPSTRVDVSLEQWMRDSRRRDTEASDSGSWMNALGSVDNSAVDDGSPATADPGAALRLSRARGLEERGESIRAFAAFCDAFDAGGVDVDACVDGLRRTFPSVLDAPDTYEPVFESLRARGCWRGLLDLLAEAAGAVDAPVGIRSQMHRRAATVLAQDIGDWHHAARAYAAALELTPDDSTLIELTESAFRVLCDWSQVDQLIEHRLAFAEDSDARRVLLLEQATIRLRELGEPLSAYEAIRRARREDDVGSEIEAMSFLRELVADERAFGALTDAVREWIASSGGDEARSCLLELAELRVTGGAHWTSVEPLVEYALERAPDDVSLFMRATRIAEATGDSMCVARWLGTARQRPLSEGPKIDALARAADLFEHTLDRTADARDALEAVWLMRPDDGATLTRLLAVARRARPPARLARILERALADVLSGQWPVGPEDVDALSPAARETLRSRLRLLAHVRARDTGQPERAVECHRAILRLDPLDREALAALRRRFRATGAWPALAEVTERVLDGAREHGDDMAVEELSRELAAICDRRLDDPERAARVLEPLAARGHRGVRVELERLYRRTGNVDGRLSMLEMELDDATEPRARAAHARRIVSLATDQPDQGHRLELALLELAKLDPMSPSPLRKLAEVYRTRDDSVALVDTLGQLWSIEPTAPCLEVVRERAQRLVEPLARWSEAEAAWSLLLRFAPDDAEAHDHLDRVFEATGQHKKRLGLLLRRQAITNDRNRQVEFLRTAARICDAALGEPKRAIGIWKKLLLLRREDVDALDELMRLLEQQEAWDDYIRVAHLRLDVLEPDERRDAARVLARRCAQMGRFDDAQVVWERVVHLDPDDSEALASLLEIAERKNDIGALGERLAALAQRTEDADERRALLERRASVLDRRGDNKAAIETWWAVHTIAPDDRGPLLRIRDLAELGSDWGRYAQALTAELPLIEDEDERTGLEKRLARLRMHALGDHDGAIAPWERVLAAEPDDVDALEALQTLYAEAGRWADVTRTIESLLERADDPAQYAELLAEAARIHEMRRDDPEQAFGCWRRAAKMHPASAVGMRREMRRLAEAYELWRPYFEVLTEALRGVEREAEAIELYCEQAEIAERAFVDDAGAFELYRRAFELAPGDGELLRSIEELARRLEHWPALMEAYDRVLSIEELPISKRVNVLLRAAELAERGLGEPMRALSTYATALLAGAEPGAIRRAMRGTAERHDLWHELNGLYERILKVDLSPGERLRVLEELAEMREEHLRDWPAAFDAAVDALALDPRSESARARAWRLAAAHDRWGPIVGALERAVAASAEAADPASKATRVAALREIARLQEKRLREPAAAMETLREALAADRGNAATLAELGRLAATVRGGRALAAILEEEAEWAEEVDARLSLYREAARLVEEAGEYREAARLLRRVRELAPDDVPSARALADILRTEGDYVGLAEVLESLAEVGADERRGEILGDLVAIYRDWLDDEGQAESAMKRLLEVRPDDAVAFEAQVTRLTRLAAWPELDALLAHRVDSVDPDEAARLTVRRAHLLASKRDAPDRAFDLLVEVCRSRPQDAAVLFEAAALEEALGDRFDSGRARALAAAADATAEQGPIDRRADALVLVGRLARDRLDDPGRAWRALVAASERRPDDVPLARDALALLEIDERHSEIVELLCRVGPAVVAQAGELTERDVDEEIELSDTLAARCAMRIATLQAEHLFLLDEAAETLTRLIEAQPDHREALELSRRLSHRRLDVDAYHTAVESLARTAPDPAAKIDVLAKGARDLEELDAADKAIRLWQRVLEQMPDHDAAREAVLHAAENTGNPALRTAEIEARARAAATPVARAVVCCELAAHLRDAVHDRSAAEDAFRHALEADPRNVDAVIGLVELMRERGDFDMLAAVSGWVRTRLDGEADESTRRRLEPQLALVLLDRARLAAVGESPDAESIVEWLTEAHVLDGGNASVAWALADAKLASGDAAEAARLYAEAQGVPPAPPGCDRAEHLAAEHAARAEAFVGAGRDEDAIRHYEAVAQYSKRRGEAYEALVGIHERAGHWALAVPLREKLAELADTPEARRQMLRSAGEVLEREVGRLDDALRLYTRAVEAGEEDPEFLRHVLDLHRRAKANVAATPVVERLLPQARDANAIAELYCVEGESLRRTCDGAGALGVFRKAIEHSPLMRSAARGLVDCLADVEPAAQVAALRQLRDGVNSVSGRARLPVLEILAEALQARGDISGAVEAYEEISALAPAHRGARAQLDRLHSQLGGPSIVTSTDVAQLRRAIDHRLAAARRRPADPEGLRDLVRLCESAGRAMWADAPIQLLALIGHADLRQRERALAEPTGPIVARSLRGDADRIRRLASDGEWKRPIGALFNVLHSWIAPALDDLFGSPDILPANAADRIEPTFDAEVRGLAQVISLAPRRFWLTGDGARVLTLAQLHPPELLVGGGLVGHMPVGERWFLFGRCLELTRGAAVFAAFLPEAESRGILGGAVSVALGNAGEAFADAMGAERDRTHVWAEFLQDLLGPAEFRELGRLAHPVMASGPNAFDAWTDAVRRTANRVGYLLSGHFGQSLAILHAESAQSGIRYDSPEAFRAAVQQSPMIADLHHFVFSPRRHALMSGDTRDE